MRIVCAHCEKEGKPSLIEELEPRDDPRTSHGICHEHRLQLEAAIETVKEEQGQRDPPSE